MENQAYTVKRADRNISNPWLVIASIEGARQIAGAYPDRTEALNRASYLNNSSGLIRDLTGLWVRG